MIRLRSLINGQTIDLPPGQAVEITDQQGHVAVLLLHDASQNSVNLVTAAEDPETARNYSAAMGVSFSRVLVPDTTALTRQAPSPSPFK